MGELIRRYIPSWIKHDMYYLYCGSAYVVRLFVKSTENADLVKKIFEIIYSLKIREISLKVHTDIDQKGVIYPTNTCTHTCTQTHTTHKTTSCFKGTICNHFRLKRIKNHHENY